jgi:hypothetical protein
MPAFQSLRRRPYLSGSGRFFGPLAYCFKAICRLRQRSPRSGEKFFGKSHKWPVVLADSFAVKFCPHNLLKKSRAASGRHNRSFMPPVHLFFS